MKRSTLHSAGLPISQLGLGTVKFGRNVQVKYPDSFELPSDRQISALLDLATAEGINLLDTAPAYGSSEKRLGDLLGPGRDDWVIVTKVGEELCDGKSVIDFTGSGVTASVERSLRRLRTDRIECVLLHSNGDDVEILNDSGAVEALAELKSAGKILSYGISSKTVEGGILGIELGLDAVMVSYNPWHRDEEPVLDAAGKRGDCTVLIKKAFGSGWFGKAEKTGKDSRPDQNDSDPVSLALRFIFDHSAASSVISGTLNPDHLRQNAAAVRAIAGEDGACVA